METTIVLTSVIELLTLAFFYGRLTERVKGIAERLSRIEKGIDAQDGKHKAH